MSNSSRRKGLSGEAEVAAIYAAAGFDVRALEGLGDHLVVCKDALVIHSEVKRAERTKIVEWTRQANAEAPAGIVPVLAWRTNRMEWRADLPLEAFVAIAAARA